jgi:hypothetical protein
MPNGRVVSGAGFMRAERSSERLQVPEACDSVRPQKFFPDLYQESLEAISKNPKRR